MAVTYIPIASTTLTSNTSSYTFSSIPNTYTDLVLTINSAQTTAATSASSAASIRINGDTGSNYSTTFLYNSNPTVASGRNSNNTFGLGGRLNESDTNILGVGTVHFMNYSNTSTYKSFLSRGSDTLIYSIAYINTWRSTSAINSITIGTLEAGGNLLAGSSFTLYGIKAA
jgi:hypothetical protein